MGDKRKRWAAIAVIVLLLAAVPCAFWATGNHMPPKDGNGFYILPEAVFHYNIYSSSTIADVWPDQSNFVEELDPKEIAALVPDGRFPCTGTAEWDITGKLLSVHIQVEIGGDRVSVVYPLTGTYHEDPRKTITHCNGVRFAVVEDISDAGLADLRAVGDLGTQAVTVSMWCSDEGMEQERQNFETVVRWMSLCKGKQPDFSCVAYSQIPEYISRELSKTEAYGDEAFGHILPDVLPEGFAPSSFFRFKNYRSDYLRGVWKKGSGSVHIRVERCSEEDEAAVIPSEDVADAIKEKMNYPSFHLQDVTIPVLKAVSQSAYGGQIRIRVKVGDFMLEMSCRSVSHEDVHALLSRIGEQYEGLAAK